MSPKPEPARSIRRRLLIFLLPVLTALMLTGVFINYRAMMLFVRTAHDQRLGDAALVIAARVRIGDGQLDIDTALPALPAGVADRATALAYSIVGPQGQLLAGNPQVPQAPPGSANPSYADARFDGAVARVATYRLRTPAGTTTINVAGASEALSGRGRFILAGTWLMDFIQVDITLLLVWLGVHFGLRPLLTVRQQIEARSARELRPLDVSAVPAEVSPLVDALNQLFAMLSEAARAQRQFVADTAHQLRTPITGVLGELQLLMREPVAAPLHGRLAALHDGVSRLAHSANQLLALARADPAASLADKFTGIDLQALAERVVERHIDRSVASRHDLGAETWPVSVTGSARLLEDLLDNLLDNALNYTPAGGHITVRCGAADGRPYLEVEDDGPGIPEAERGRVRQRFYRLPGSTGGGCGLGLAIVEEISRLHDATLTIESGAQSGGSRMRVAFPAAEV